MPFVNLGSGQYGQQQNSDAHGRAARNGSGRPGHYAEIRKSIHEDKSLSTYGHNVKIVTQNGKVTLGGPVKTLDDKNSIHAKDAAIAGEENIMDNLQVVPPSN